MESLADTYKTKPKILVVDDEEGIREVVCMTIEKMGGDTLQAESCDAALAILQTEKVAAVLSDIRMEGKSGLDLLARCHAQGLSVPFVFLTGYDSPEYLMHAVRLGAMDFILKPLSPEELSLVLSRVLAIAHRQNLIEEIVNDLGDKLDPEKRQMMDDLKRQISMIRTMLAKKR